MNERDMAGAVGRLQVAFDAAEHAFDIGVTDTLEAHREGVLDE